MSEAVACANCGKVTADPKLYRPYLYCPPCYREGTF